MGTRANWGFRKNEEEKITYVHYDGYPTGTGNDVVNLIKIHEKSLTIIFDKINLVDDYDKCINPNDFCRKISKLTHIDLHSDSQYKTNYVDWAYIFDLKTMELSDKAIK